MPTGSRSREELSEMLNALSEQDQNRLIQSMYTIEHLLVGARKIYKNAGFNLVKQESHHSFGYDLIGENWELTL